MMGSSKRWALFTGLDIGADGDPYLDRLRIIDTPWAGLYLHHIHRADKEADPHDHPWTFWRMVLSGSYTELWWPDKSRPAKHSIRERRPLRPSLMRRRSAHIITDVKGPLWTLVLVGRDRGGWGFWRQSALAHGRRYVPHDEYLGQQPPAGWRGVGQDPRLSVELTVDDRIVRIPSIPPITQPATGGVIKVEIPYPADAIAGYVSLATVTNHDIGLTFRAEIMPRAHVRPGDTLTVPFGESSIDWLEVQARYGGLV